MPGSVGRADPSASIKSLPKTLRVQFVPAPDTARKIRAWIDKRYPDLPGSGSQQKPDIAPENEDGMAAWPDLPHVFTQAAISIVGAQIHPEVLTGELWNKLAPYLRMTFAVEQQLPPNRKNQHGRRHARGPVKTLGTGKSLVELQRRFAEQAKASARHMVEKQARNAGDQGKFVEQANLLNKAGATTEARATMLWQGALDTLRLPGERISSRWLGTEALMLASAPYKSTKELTEDLQLAAVKRLLPNIDQLPDDEALADAVLDVREVYEDTVYAVAHDVIAILKRYAEVDKAVSGKADLPLLSVLQSNPRTHRHTRIPRFHRQDAARGIAVHRTIPARRPAAPHQGEKRQEPRRAMGLGSQRSQTTCRQGRGESTT